MESSFSFQHIRNVFESFVDCLVIISVFKVAGSFPRTKDHLIFYRRERFTDGVRAFNYILKIIKKYFDADFEALVFGKFPHSVLTNKIGFLVVSHYPSSDTVYVSYMTTKKLYTESWVIRK